jgi:hypothetical protein
MNLTDLLYDNFIGVFGDDSYQKLLAIVLLTVYFYTDVKTRFLSPPYVKEELSRDESDFKEMDLGPIRCCETLGCGCDEKEPQVENQAEYTSDFISESESESEQESDSSREKTLIKKHFKILNDIQATKFKHENYSCSYHYKCINSSIKLECCFCKICGNYICYKSDPDPKIICTHYKLIDSVDSRLDIFSGHIRTDDEQDVRNTINSFFETGDELEMQFYRTRLRQFVYDEIQTDTEETNTESESEN